jgi:hypothetical protein
VHRQTGDVNFDKEVDRTYLSSAEAKMKHPVLKRLLSVQGTSTQSTVVWNPWIAKARALTDLPDQDYLRFVCVETASVRRPQRRLRTSRVDRILELEGCLDSLSRTSSSVVSRTAGSFKFHLTIYGYGRNIPVHRCLLMPSSPKRRGYRLPSWTKKVHEVSDMSWVFCGKRPPR